MDKRYRSMDLLRAVAIMMVLFGHTILSYGSPPMLAPLQLGGTGVDLFFLLSGWLLGGQLFKEAQRYGNIDIKRFWVRRWLRTLPAYYAVLIFSVAQRYLTKEDVAFPWTYFVFVQNYDYPLEFFSISWSLCVEEQFYLVIAPLIALLTFHKKSLTTAVLSTALILPFLFRSLDWYSHSNQTHARLDCCIAGVLLAHIYQNYRALWQQIVRYTPAIAILSLAVYLMFYVGRYTPLEQIHNPNKLLLAFIFGGFLIVANANETWSRNLYLPGAYYIATRSYAIYLLHPEVLALLRRFLSDIPFSLYFLLAVVGSCLVAEVLYRLVELPIMNSRERFSFSASRNKVEKAQ